MLTLRTIIAFMFLRAADLLSLSAAKLVVGSVLRKARKEQNVKLLEDYAIKLGTRPGYEYWSALLSIEAKQINRNKDKYKK